MIRKYLVILLLAAVTAAVYWQVRTHDYVYYDDQEYVMENRHVQDGLTWKNVRWAFTATYAANWHPVTWLSHMADRQFFGPSAAGPHLVNLFLHILNSVLLMVLLYRMTNGFWQSAFVAALFALHPLHVESVAWVAERKDVLSALFFMLTLLCYTRYVERPGTARYLAALVCFAMGLMAKPMLVTLPFVLFLLDFWPLKRFERSSSAGAAKPRSPGHSLRRLVLEKIPFLALAVLSSVITVIAQRKAMPSIDDVSLSFRLGNAAHSYAAYLMKMVLPVDLAVFYPLALEEPWKIAGAAALLVAISAWAVLSWRKRPYVLIGWLWYVGTLVPVIGIVQVGAQSMADRYTYLPLVGIFIVAAWGLAEAAAHRHVVRMAAAGGAITVLTVFSGLAWAQTGHWKNSLALFSHCAEATQDNYLALSQEGFFLAKQNRAAEALPVLQKAFALKSNDPVVLHGLGCALSQLGRDPEAVSYIRETIRVNPNNPRAHYDLGILISRSGDHEEAVRQFREALRLEPDDPDYRFEFAVALVDTGRLAEGIKEYAEVLKEKPDYADAYVNTGVALARQGNMGGAIEYFSRALELNPNNADAQRYLRLAESRLSAPDRASPQ